MYVRITSSYQPRHVLVYHAFWHLPDSDEDEDGQVLDDGRSPVSTPSTIGNWTVCPANKENARRNHDVKINVMLKGLRPEEDGNGSAEREDSVVPEGDSHDVDIISPGRTSVSGETHTSNGFPAAETTQKSRSADGIAHIIQSPAPPDKISPNNQYSKKYAG